MPIERVLTTLDRESVKALRRGNTDFNRLRYFFSHESRDFSRKPTNYLALQQAYEKIVSDSSERETGVTFLTDQRDLIVPVFAATGSSTRVDFPNDYHFKLLEKLSQDTKRNSIVTFHNHVVDYVNPNRPSFSLGDMENFVEYLDYAKKWFYRSKDFGYHYQKVRVFDAVASLKNQYKWQSFAVDPNHFRYEI